MYLVMIEPYTARPLVRRLGVLLLEHLAVVRLNELIILVTTYLKVFILE